MPRLSVPDVLVRTLARQLGDPSGPLGAVVARMLNKGNGRDIRAAVEALALTGSEEVADIGFGGGLGLDLLLDATRAGGRVHGVEPSPDMVRRARRAHPEEVRAGRLALHQGRMEALPLTDGALQGWISLNTVYFIDDLPAAFAELHRVLAPGGRGVLGLADPEWMAQTVLPEHNFRVRPLADVLALLAAADLSVDRRTLEGSHPFNLLVCRPVGTQ